MRASRIAHEILSNTTLKNAALLAAFLVFGNFNASSATSAKVPANLWYGIYLLNTPIGGSSQKTAISDLGGRACTETICHSATHVHLFGASVDQDVMSWDWSDKKTGMPIQEKVVMASGGQTTTVTAKFTPRVVTATLDSGGATETHILKVPTGFDLLVDDPTMTPPKASGKKYVYFDPASLALQPVTVTIPAGQPKLHPHLFIVSMPTGTVTVLQDDAGVPIKMTMPGGLSMQRESETVATGYMSQGSAADATGAVEAAAPDFATVTSVEPSGVRLLDDPTYLQAVVTVSGKAPQTVVVQSVANPTQAQATGTLADVNNQPDLAPYLANASYLGINNLKIQKEANEIKDGRTNLYQIAVQIVGWVHQDMTPTATIGLPRSAMDILSDPRGVCRDYALLYTALARSAGVPTKLCAGLVGYQGRFFYHAWVESYIGGSVGWLSFDPTLNQAPVDASHIALVQGDPANLYDLAGQIGQIKVDIIRCAQ